MKNRIIYVFLILTVMTGMFSCADLDMPSDGRITLEEIFSSYYRTRAYFSQCRGYVPQVGFTLDNTPLASYCDEAHDASDNVSGSVYEWYTGRTSPTWNPITVRDANGDPWDRYFQGIRKCNIFLASVTNPSLATYNAREVEKNGWIAEVRVLRAYYYLQLIKRYGGVPINDTPYEVNQDFSDLRRASFEECADFIMADCDAALATAESEGLPIGFRWAITDAERSTITRGFAHAVRSQTALYAASPLWYTPDSKYTWEKATEITKEALDACLAHGYELFNTPVDPDVAQNSYAWYFIQRSDPSRSADKETLYETTVWRTNVWSLAGTPIIPGIQKAGPGPSQELVDCYEMADGTLPILGYTDADHLQPILNPASSYDPANPYANRDPRFYASIYYNEAPRTLGGEASFEDFPQVPNLAATQLTFEDHGDYFHLTSTGTDPHISALLATDVTGVGTPYVKFEYKSNFDLVNTAQFFCYYPEAPNGSQSSTPGLSIPQADDWTEFECDLSAFFDAGFGKQGQRFRFDIGNVPDYEISFRNFRIQFYIPPPPPTPVETFVGGNCEISDRVTDSRYTRTGYYMRKFNNYRSDSNVDADGYMKIFRLGELYLNYAEAACENNRLTEAKAAVDEIRKRAGMPELPTGLSQDELRQRIRNERRIELAFEEHRFFDVRRWKILHETDNFVTGMRITQNPDGTFTYNRVKLAERGTHTNKYLMFPIKQDEVTKMEDATGVAWQNPEW